MKKKLFNDYLTSNIPNDSKFSYPEVKNALEVLLNHESGYPWVNEFEKKLYVVFNAVNPDILYPKSKDAEYLKNLLLNEKLNQLKNFLKNKEISYFDFNKYILNKYNEDNISTMFKKIDGHWDHYTEKGFYEISEQGA